MATGTLQLESVGALKVHATADYQTLREEWRALEPHASDPFCGYAWCSAWYQAIVGQRHMHPLIITVRDAKGQLQSLLPLVRERMSGLRMLTRPGRAVSGDFAGLFTPKLRAVLADPTRMAKLWDAMLNAAGSAEVLVLNGVRRASHSPLASLSHLPSGAPSFSVRLESDWEAQYQALFASKIKRNDRRSLARLTETGPTEFVRPQDPKAQGQILEVLLDQKRRQIEQQGEQHELAQEHVMAFYRALPQQFAQSEQQSLVVSGLSLQGDLIATSCGILANQHYYGMFMAMDAGPSRKFSPGRLLLLDINRYLCQQGCRVHEFGNGEYHYKNTWKCDRHDRVTVVSPVSRVGKLLLPIARRAVELRRQYQSRVRPASPSPAPGKSASLKNTGPAANTGKKTGKVATPSSS